MLRKIVFIDEEKCDGCGLCIPNCAEGAIEIIDGKAKLISDNLCDGLGACLGHCPQDAIHVIEREADEFDEEAVDKHLEKLETKTDSTRSIHQPMGGCPGSRMVTMDINEDEQENVKISSQLRQWPVQLHLVPPNAPYLKNSDLLITADCVPLAYGNYHQDLLKGKSVVMGCPKLDDVQSYVERLTEMIEYNDFNSITIAFMEVPCCGGIIRALEIAMDKADKQVPVNKVKITIDGQKLNM
jgi:NAD-dependent dihydropyrimidine dehydrogenase PreA subunit